MRSPYDKWFDGAAFDATYGFDDAALRAIAAPPEPAGFEQFWTGLFAEAMTVDPAPRRRLATRSNDLDMYEIEYTSLGRVQLGGWLAVPSDGMVERAFVIGHGYGGREAPDRALPGKRAAAIFPCARGLPTRSVLPELPFESAEHVVHGLGAVETYIHAGCAADIWCAASALLSLLPVQPDRLDYLGRSFGGGIGALALPWDDRFTGAALALPSFGQHDLRLAMPCTGSGEAVRRYVAEHPEARDVLSYFDAATAARRLTIPTLVAPALCDPAVPPPGQFSVFNALPGPKQLFVLSAGHAQYPTAAAEEARLFEMTRQFLARSTDRNVRPHDPAYESETPRP